MSASRETADELLPLFDALGLPSTLAQRQRLVVYLNLLERWNATYNLTAVRERGAMLTQHLADCLAVVLPLQACLGAGESRGEGELRAGSKLVDVGSGAGLPGVVFAIMLDQLDVSCVDAVGKKAAFIRQVASTLKLPNLHAIHARVETLKVPTFDLVVSRAFATLDKFIGLTRGCVKPEGVWLAMKGKVPIEELGALPSDIEVFHVEQLSVPGLDAQRCLIRMRALKAPAGPV